MKKVKKIRMLLIAFTMLMLGGCKKEEPQDVSWCEGSVKEFNHGKQRKIFSEITATLSNGEKISCRRVMASDVEMGLYKEETADVINYYEQHADKYLKYMQQGVNVETEATDVQEYEDALNRTKVYWGEETSYQYIDTEMHGAVKAIKIKERSAPERLFWCDEETQELLKTEQDIYEDAHQILKEAGIILNDKLKVESAMEKRTYSTGKRVGAPVSNSIMEAEVVDIHVNGISVKVTDKNHLYRDPAWGEYTSVGVSMIQGEECPSVTVGDRVYICYKIIQETSPPSIRAEKIFYSREDAMRYLMELREAAK